MQHSLACAGDVGQFANSIFLALRNPKVLVREQPDALYVWAWKGQIGTAETCDDPETSWRYAPEVLRKAVSVYRQK